MNHIKVTNNYLLQIMNGALMKFSSETMPFYITYHLNLCFEKLQPAIMALQKTRKAIVDKHVQLDKDGAVKQVNGRMVFKTSQEEFEKDMQELLVTNVEIDVEPLALSLEEMKKLPDISLSDLAMIKALIVVKP